MVAHFQGNGLPIFSHFFMFSIHTALCGMKGTTNVEIFGWVCLIAYRTKCRCEDLFSTDERLTEGLGGCALSRVFVNRSTFCLLYFATQFLWKHALFFFKDSYRVVCTGFPFSLSISVIESHSRSRSPRFLNSGLKKCSYFRKCGWWKKSSPGRPQKKIYQFN